MYTFFYKAKEARRKRFFGIGERKENFVIKLKVG